MRDQVRNACVQAASKSSSTVRSIRGSARNACERPAYNAVFMAAGAKPSLLVIDDEPELAELIAEFARRAGYDVTLYVEPGRLRRAVPRRL